MRSRKPRADLGGARGDAAAGAATRLARAAAALEALVEVHLAKEERAYLPLFAAHLSGAEQGAILRRMHGEPVASERWRTIAARYDTLASFTPDRFHPIPFGQSERSRALLVCLEPGQFIPVHAPERRHRLRHPRGRGHAHRGRSRGDRRPWGDRVRRGG